MEEISRILDTIRNSGQRQKEFDKILSEIEKNRKLSSINSKLSLFNRCLDKSIQSIIFVVPSEKEMEEYQNCIKKEISADSHMISYYKQLENPSLKSTLNKFSDYAI